MIAIREALSIRNPLHVVIDIKDFSYLYNFYRRMCKKLDIPISRDLIRGPHGFRRNAITDVVERSGGNIIMAAQLFGNSPEVAKKNYYTGLNMATALNVLDA